MKKSILVAALATASSLCFAQTFPVTVDNCGEPLTFSAPPKRAVVHDLNMTEMAFALNLQDSMVGDDRADLLGEMIRLGILPDSNITVLGRTASGVEVSINAGAQSLVSGEIASRVFVIPRLQAVPDFRPTRSAA